MATQDAGKSPSEHVLSLFQSAPAFEVGHWLTDEQTAFTWPTLWRDVAGQILRHLENGRHAEFEEAFPVVGEALEHCGPVGRQAAVRSLFGEFTRRAIAAGCDRTRFADWFQPVELFAPSGPHQRRGRVLYFNALKGRGKILGSNRIVFFVHFSAVRGEGFRSLESGELVEFSPTDGPGGPEAWNVVRMTEDGRQREGE